VYRESLHLIQIAEFFSPGVHQFQLAGHCGN